jgi:hypothetical protein
VASHISRKKSEMWGTQGSVEGGNPGVASGGACGFSPSPHDRNLQLLAFPQLRRLREKHRRPLFARL